MKLKLTLKKKVEKGEVKYARDVMIDSKRRKRKVRGKLKEENIEEEE